MKEEWTKRGEMPSICVYVSLFPRRSGVIRRDETLAWPGGRVVRGKFLGINVGWLGWLSLCLSVYVR
jgi:hypothetical protein